MFIYNSLIHFSDPMISHPLRVLYVDDEPTLLDIAKIFLERTEGFTVDIVESAEDALEKLKTTQYDAIISDYQMPVMDGIELLIKVRSSFGDIPFILFTGRGREEVVATAIDSGVDFYLQKGGDPKSQFKELAHKVRRSVKSITATRALAENEERMRLALEGAKEGHWEVNVKTGKSYLSPRGCEILGYTQEEIEQFGGMHWRDLVHPDDISIADTALSDYYNHKSDVFQVEQRFRMKNGEYKWMLVRGKVIEYDDNNHPVRFVGTQTDITEQKKAEQDLRVAKKDWETIFRAIGNPILILDEESSIIEANESVMALTGLSLDQIKGQKCWHLFHGPNLDKPVQGCPFELMKSNQSKTTIAETEAFGRTFLTSCTPVMDEQGRLSKAIHIATDITENKRLEKKLEENRDYLNQIFTSVKEGIAIIDVHTHEILDVNPAAIAMIGAKKEDIIHQICHRFICPACVGKCPITDLRQNVDNAERVLLTADGTSIPIIKHVVPFEFQGRSCLLETFIDNSERKKAHDSLSEAYQQLSDAQEELRAQFDELKALKNALEASEVKFRTIVETSPDILWDMTLDGVLTYISPRLVDVIGFLPEEFIGKSIEEILDPQHSQIVRTLFEESALKKTGVISVDIPYMSKDGEDLTLNIRSSIIRDEKGDPVGYRGIARDVTKYSCALQELQEQKCEIEHLSEQKGLFITQLAHDLRTPLTPIVGMGPLLLSRITDPDAQEFLKIFLKSIGYLQKTTENILTLATLNQKHTLEKFDRYDLSELISDAITANEFLADQKSVTFVNHVQPGIYLDLSKLYAHQIFRNLLSNAVKYNIPDGTVTITACAVKNEIKIEVSDTGIGVPPENLGKIWDEFFIGDPARSDPLSKGFGLSIVKKIVELHKGTVDVQSEGHMKGTTISVYIPLITEP